MAARSGTRQSPASPSSGRPSYEDIEPKSAEWKEEKTAHILNVHLPGFVKEQIRATYDESSRSFNVRGDRPLGNNRFGRLNIDFTIPDKCKMDDMQAKFKDGVLTITVPKDSILPSFVPKETTPKSQLPASPSSQPQEIRGRPSYEDIEPKSAQWKEEKTAHILNVHLPGFVKEQIRIDYDDSSRSFNVRGDRPLGNNRFGRLDIDFTFPDNCKMEDMQARFQDEVLTITIPKDSISPFFVPKETTPKSQLPPGKAPSINQKPPVISEPPKVPPKMAPPPEGRSDYEKFESPKGRPTRNSLDPKAAERPGEKVSGFDGKETRSPKLSDLAKSKAVGSESGVDDAKKKKRDGNVGEAEKQLIVNLGVAALVLMAMGAYVGYNLACLKSAKD